MRFTGSTRPCNLLPDRFRRLFILAVTAIPDFGHDLAVIISAGR
jgi:hypothetical protein